MSVIEKINRQISFRNKMGSEEKMYKSSLTLAAFIILLLLAGIFITLLVSAYPTIKEFGFGFIFSKEWNPVLEKFGALPFIVGTLITSFFALLISTPISLAVALFLGEYYRKGKITNLFNSILEILAGIPSVIYGFVALFFISPMVRWLEFQLGIPSVGLGILTASIVLAVMIIPYSAAIARDAILLINKDLKESGYALGATQYELIRYLVIPQAKSGIIAGILLSLGRALGETMAVTMVIGNSNTLPSTIFSSSNTMASIIANEFAEAASQLHVSSLIEIGLVLFIITALFNLIGKYFIKTNRR